MLLDNNVLLDSVLQRPPWHAEADAILQAAARGAVVCAVTTLSVVNLFYIGRRLVGLDQARAGVRICLTNLEILAVDRQALLNADALPGSDFEDNFQIAAAVAAVIDGIVTRDPSDFRHSPIPVWSPSELLQRLTQIEGSGVP